jgi:hypothetical protein
LDDELLTPFEPPPAVTVTDPEVKTEALPLVFWETAAPLVREYVLPREATEMKKRGTPPPPPPPPPGHWRELPAPLPPPPPPPSSVT